MADLFKIDDSFFTPEWGKTKWEYVDDLPKLRLYPPEHLVVLMQDGDRLGFWDWYAGVLAGRGGFCIVRDGKPILGSTSWIS